MSRVDESVPAGKAATALAVTVLLAAGCGASASQPASPASGAHPVPVALAEVPSNAKQHVLSALDDPAAPGLPRPLVDPNQIIDGGPPPDGIPAIDHPRFLRAADVHFLRDREAVIAVDVAGKERAYPVQTRRRAP